ncbi:MAG: hypothetical protein CL510_10145 [Actinobacteria bacterium]|nr:hypothetical protein [Actinomycetota bacterium]
MAATETEQELAKTSLEQVQDRNWQEAVSNAIASGDAPTMQLVADTMKAEGMESQSKALQKVIEQEREAAAIATNEIRAKKAESKQEPEPEPITAKDIQKAEPAPAPAPVDPRRIAAGELATYLESTSRYKENRDKVASYQETLGLDPDGLYGSETALELIAYGIIPPAPFYWPRSNALQAVSDYKSILKEKAATDPNRKELWIEAIEKAGK